MRLSLLNKVEDAHEDAVWTAAWAGPELLLTGSVDESVKLWSEVGDTLEAHHTYTGHTLGVISVAVDVSNTYAASSALDSFIRVWSLADNSTKAVIETQPSETWTIAFASGGEGSPLLLAAAGGSSNKIKLYNVDTGAEHSSLALPAAEDAFKKDKFVLSVAQSPCGRRLASGSMDGSVAIFDLATGSLLHTLEGHFKPVRSLCFTPGHESWVLSVAAHPDGSTFATGSSDCRVKLWDLQTRSCAQTVTEHTDQVWGVAFRPDGNRLVSVSDDKSVALYDCA